LWETKADFQDESVIFARQNRSYMDQEQEIKNPKLKDFAYNWVNSSVFLFYLQVFCVVAFLLGGCYGLYTHRYKGKPETKVPQNTLYTPQYK
jgi:hypothetical protein